MALDRIDVAILDALQNDARRSNKVLAADVGLFPSSCLERVRALRKAGILKGQHAEVSPAALGIGVEALIAIRLVRHSTPVFKKLYAHMLALPEVMAIYHVSGINDLQAHVAVRDVGHLRDLIVERIATRAEVDHCETAVIYALHRKHRLPCYLDLEEPLAAKRGARRNR